jgi:hypothetical protein
LQSLDEEAAYRKDRLVLACRILAREGYEFCGTYISVRASGYCEPRRGV